MNDYGRNFTFERIVASLKPARLYKGVRDRGRALVSADKRELLPDRSQEVWNHSPDGFEWGYNGSGPSQLALALLLDVGLPADFAVALHVRFRQKWVATLDRDRDWYLIGADIVAWIADTISGDLIRIRELLDDPPDCQ